MASIIVCPLSRLAGHLAASGAEEVVTLMRRDAGGMPRLVLKRHLWLEISDITAETDGHTLAAADHLDALLRFARGWDGRRPLLVHCYAGVSRSTAAAYVLACAARPDIGEGALAGRLRALSPTATPNARLVSLADARLGRAGRMVGAIAAIGRGADCFEGVPFSLDLGDQMPPYQS